MTEKYRIVQTDDLDLVQEISKRIFPEDAKLCGPELDDSEWWLLKHGKDVVGFAGVHVVDQDAKLVRAGVAAEARGRGLQKRLIRTRLAFAKAAGATKAYTYTATKNIASQRSLLACGFLPYRYEWTGDNGFIHFTRALTK